MLLAGKNAVVYGGGGAIGSAVARALSRDGARVHLAGRTRSKLDAVVADIAAAGGYADATSLDATDESAVQRHLDGVAGRFGAIDIALNAVGITHVQGTPLPEVDFDEYALPLVGYTRTNFVTAKAAARHMVAQRSGVILMLSTPGSRMAGGGFLGYGAACAAIEAMTRHLAGELGPHGVRVLCLRADAIPEALRHGSHTREVFHGAARRHGASVDALLAERAKSASLLRRLPTLQQVADTAAFVASDRAAAMTGSVVDVTCGSTLSD
jgi:3-oxoacyl-[acyl-carrier protein] reductase